MPIEHYYGTNEGFTVSNASAKDVYDALDEMHTQVITRMDRSLTPDPKDTHLMRWLESAMNILEAQFDYFEEVEGQ